MPGRQGHPYYIAAPDYREASAGVRVMHRLCHTLNSNGLEAYIIGAEAFHPELTTPPLDDETAARHRSEGKVPIAVYSEIIAGNPLNAAVCVRYMLNKEGVIDGNPINAGLDDFFFYYSRAFTPAPNEKVDYLRLNTYDLALFKPDTSRSKTGPLLYLNRIPASSIDFSVLPRNIEILSNQKPLPLESVAEKLQGATVLYSYESSGTCTLAMLCGCPVVAMTLPGYEKLGFSKQALSIYGGKGYALADGNDDIQAARDTLPFIRQGLLNVEREFINELNVFIDKTQHKAETIALEMPPAFVKNNTYQDWIASHRVQAVDRHEYDQWFAQVAYKPHFHIAVVHEGDSGPELARTLRSLAGQYYSEVSVTIASALPAPDDLMSDRLDWLQGEDVWKSADLALRKASTNAWVGLVRTGDALALHALQTVAEYLANHPDALAVYTDEDIIEIFGTRHSPCFKPDFDLRFQLDSGYIGGLILAKNQVLQTAGGWHRLVSREDELDLAVRLSEHIPAASFGHVPDVLYHRNSRYATLSEDQTTEHQLHSGLQTLSVPSSTGGQSAPDQPVVSILIPTRDQLPALQRCIESLFQHTSSVFFELILVDHESTDNEACAFLAGLPAIAPDRLRVRKAQGDFNFSTLINIAARDARGTYLLLLNNDTAALHPEWLPALISEMDDPAVGIVGPRLVFPDGRIQHAGVVLGLSGAADYPWVGAAMDEPGYLGLLAHVHQVSAVSGSAMLIRQSLFKALGGMDEHYAIAYGDVDICLRARKAGYRCIWTPHATLLHEAGQTLKSIYATPQAGEAAKRGFAEARQRLLQNWLPQLARDPFYNVNLSLSSRRFELESNRVLQPFVAGESARLRVLALPADDAGSGIYRVQQPASRAAQCEMVATRLASGYPSPIHFERLGIQTLFSQRQVDDNHLQALGELREMLPGLRVVMDFDDLLTAVPQQSHYHHTVWKDMPRRLGELGELVDCLTVSTAPLADAMRAYHADVRHIPNGLDPRRWKPRPPSTRSPSAKLRVGWAGGISHAGDLAVVRKVVKTLAKEVEWVFFGMCPEDMRAYLTELHDAVPFDQYPLKLAELDLDLAIAPLELNRFNECKSNLRLLEYGALGIPVVATDITPYQCDLPVTLVDSRSQSWIRAIRERIGERAALRRDGLALREEVLRNWVQDTTLPAWVSAWTA